MVTSRARTRALLIALVSGVPVAGAAIACTAGDPIAYSAAAVVAEAGSDAGDEGGTTNDGGLVTMPAQSDGGVLPSVQPIACSGFDAGCDPSEGKGCCLAGNSDPTGSSNTCVDQLQHYSGTACKDDDDVFLGCLGSNNDSTCCWLPEGSNRMNTRFRADCDGGVEACDPNVDGGGVCTTGGACASITCKGVLVGYCGGGAAPCQ
ncbi:MAG: hypothetical protein JWO86_8295 [Myxococcaceae bacterium]|jgi:hypothetical protein|nr:hypothetical protein [Myxococcaceae bacterium]MEA2748431.1 hypothetical protein [Myxococcales bacterium]